MNLQRKLFLGFIRVHILHHAAKDEIYGTWMIDELEHHGYTMSPGTLYPILHGLESDGLLKVESRTVEGKVRKYYRTTKSGNSALKDAQAKVKELFHEVVE